MPQRASAASSADAGIDPARAGAVCSPSSRTAPASSGSPSGTRRPGRPRRGAPRSPPPARSARAACSSPTRWITRAARMSKRRQRLVDHRLDRALGHAGVVLELHRRDTPAPSLRSRTVPTKAGDRTDAARRPRAAPRPRRRDRSRSCWIVTRARHGAVTSAAGHRREEGDLGALARAAPSRRTGRGRARSARPCRAPAPRHGAPPRASKRVAQVRRAWCPRRPRPPRCAAQRLAQRGEVAHLRPSSQQHPRSGRKRHRVAARDRRAAGVVDQAVGPDRRGQHAELWLANRSGRPRRCGARAGTRAARSARGQSKSARIAIGRGASSVGALQLAAAPAAPPAGR